MKSLIFKHLVTLLVFSLLAQLGVSGSAYDFSKLKREKLGRGLVVVRENDSTVNISWRYFSADPIDIGFEIYRNSEKISPQPLRNATYFKDNIAVAEDLNYEIRAVNGKDEEIGERFAALLKKDAPIGYINIPLEVPEGGMSANGRPFFYQAGDASIGDVDGDGEYEIILKWDPSNARDNAHDGITGNVFFDCYKLTGERLWRIDLGRNIRAGAHYTQFMVYDLDGDNKAEIVIKTGDGTVDGQGNVIGDKDADHRNEVGRILSDRNI